MITDVTTTAATTSAADAAMKKSSGMNKDDFLKLFVTQLQNQDPLNPQDGTQFIAQLAQLTQVEQAYNTNTNLQSILSQGSNSSTMATVSLIGKQVMANGSQLNLTSGGSAAANFKLNLPATQVTVKITDGTGAVVKSLTQGATPAGMNSIAWDGTDKNGNKVASGAYNFSVSATDSTGNSVTSTPYIVGKVDGVDLSGTTPTLSMGSLTVNLTDVTSVTAGV